MWHIEKPELRPATLDFTSSEQGRRNVTQLFADGVQVMNAIELTCWSADDFQFLICEACGIEHCKPGDWVRLRRSDSLVLILPASDYIWPESENDKTEYRPPQYLKTHGIAYFDRSTYEHLRLQHAAFPAFAEIAPLTMREATLIFHWQAPAEVLGPPPEVRVRHELLVDASAVNQLEELIQKQYQDESPAVLRPLWESEIPLSIYLDAAEFVDWKPLVAHDNMYNLVIDSEFVITSAGR